MDNKVGHGIECYKCGARIFSDYTHDFKFCPCKTVFVDGGYSYLRYGGGNLDEIRLVKREGGYVNTEFFPKLCYIIDCWAYFTYAPLKEQWGDDWDDAPYEHNAGEPYEHPGHKITKVAFDGEFYDPAYIAGDNSQYCVKDINEGQTPWLINGNKGISIYAGVSLEEFTKAIKEGGGNVYSLSAK